MIEIQVGMRGIMAKMIIRVKVRAVKEFRFRFWLSTILFRLAARVMGTRNTKVEIRI